MVHTRVHVREFYNDKGAKSDCYYVCKWVIEQWNAEKHDQSALVNTEPYPN